MKNTIIISAPSGNNLNLAKKIGGLIDFQYQIISLEDYHLPLYTGNGELKNKILINYLCQKVINANGFIFYGPEYNGVSAPILNNAITWIFVTTDYLKGAFKDKGGLIANHSGGDGDSFLLTFKHQLEFLGIVVYAESVKVNEKNPFDVSLTKNIMKDLQCQL